MIPAAAANVLCIAAEKAHAMENLVQLIITIIVTSISVYFAAWLALRNHTYVRWGEQKQKAYQDIIDALYLRAEYFNHKTDAEQQG